MFQVSFFTLIFTLPCLSSSAVTLCQLSRVQQKSPTQTAVWHGHISLLSGVLCRPVVSDPLFNLGRTILQASSLPLLSAHNSLCGRTSQPGAAAGLSHSCSGFDLLPFTPDLSHRGRLTVRGSWERHHSNKTFVNISVASFKAQKNHAGLLAQPAALSHCLRS